MDDPSQLVKVVSHLSKKIARFVSLLKLLESSGRKNKKMSKVNILQKEAKFFDDTLSVS